MAHVAPRDSDSFRTMEGFGINTFRLVNARGDFKFVKFHWKPVLGVHSLVWDEAQKISGKDPDYHRRDLWDNILNGHPAEFELAIQVLNPEDEFAFDFDILTPPKQRPEELVPQCEDRQDDAGPQRGQLLRRDRTGGLLPGKRGARHRFYQRPAAARQAFSYLDTQISRLGGPNFHQIPINRPLPKINNQRDGMHRMTIDQGQTSRLLPHPLNDNQPHPAGMDESHFEHYQKKVEGHVIRQRSESFRDHFSQPAMFWNSMSSYEKQHIVDAFRFELGKCKSKEVRQKIADLLVNVNRRWPIRWQRAGRHALLSRRPGQARRFLLSGAEHGQYGPEPRDPQGSRSHR